MLEAVNEVDFGGWTGKTLDDAISTPELHIQLTEGENFELIDKLKQSARFEGAQEVIGIDGVRVTTPLRTLIDVITEVHAVDQALRWGWSCERQLETARVSTRARQRMDRILKQVPARRRGSPH